MPIILVTGGNRGIGLATVELLGSRIPNATILIGCRTASNAEAPIRELKEKGVPAKLEALEITITDDSSIMSAAKVVDEKYGKLDVPVNNAGAVTVPKSDDFAEIRKSWTETLDCFVTSQILVTKAFLSLLRKSDWGRVVMVSSARGSLERNSLLQLPPSPYWMYNCSKAAINLATIEFQKAESEEIADEQDRVSFWTTSPGHCKTGFNNFRGVKDPLEGAEVTVRLIESQRGEYPPGTSWEFEHGKFQQVPW